jgi:hypothetical protein
MRTASLVRVGIAALAVAGSVAGCGVPVDPEPHTVTAPAPYRVTEAPPTDDDVITGPVVKTLYLTRDRTVVKVLRAADQAPTAEELLTDLTDGATTAERELGLTSALAGTVLESPAVTFSDGIMTVDLGDGLDGLSANTRVLAYAQIVCTLHELPGVTGVLFSRSGQRVPVPNGDGTPTSNPLTPSDYATVLAPA